MKTANSKKLACRCYTQTVSTMLLRCLSVASLMSTRYTDVHGCDMTCIVSNESVTVVVSLIVMGVALTSKLSVYNRFRMEHFYAIKTAFRDVG